MIIKGMNLQPFFAPADTIAGDATDIFETLSKNLDDKDKLAEKPSKEKDEDTDDLNLNFLEDNDENAEENDFDESRKRLENEETDDEDKEEEPEELNLDAEKEDELELAKIPKMQDIKAKYPTIFKDFPALKHIFFREKAFAEVFPTVNDAKEAKESIESFNEVQNELLSGNIEGTLKRVKATDPKAFDKIATGILDQLVRVDPNAHLGVTRQVTKGVLNYLHTAATNTLKKNPTDKQAEQLQIAAELIHDALYNTKEVSPDSPARIEEREDPEKAKFNKEREAFDQTRYIEAFNSVSSRVNNLLVSAVTKEIDPRNVLTDYVKKNLVKDIMSECDRQLVGDSRFSELIKKLWINAKNNGYKQEALDKIQEAIKYKAKTILPGIMRAKKSEAVKGLSSRKAIKEKDNDRELSRNNAGEKTTREKTTLSRRSEDDKPRDNESAFEFLQRKLG